MEYYRELTPMTQWWQPPELRSVVRCNGWVV